MVANNWPILIGVDLTDPHAKWRRPCTRALLTHKLACTFDEWRFNEAGEGMIPSSMADARHILAVDGPQGLASSADRTMRACERQLGVAGKSPYSLPPLGRPFAGFIMGSVRLFYVIYKSGKYRLYGAPRVGRSSANLIEVYPGAAWRVLSAKERLPKKTLRAGRKARLSLLQKHEVTFPGLDTQVLPTHDELDAALAAYIAYLFVNGQTTDSGEPPFEDVEHKVLREGFIVQPSERRIKWH